MNEQIQQHLNDILEMLKTGIDFASGQAPIFIQEILTYYTYYHAIFVAIFFILMCVNAYISYRLYRYQIKQYDCYEDACFMASISSVPQIFIVIGLIVNAHYLIMINVAPRLYLIETIKDLF